jgi:hypothetical protein
VGTSSGSPASPHTLLEAKIREQSPTVEEFAENTGAAPARPARPARSACTSYSACFPVTLPPCADVAPGHPPDDSAQRRRAGFEAALARRGLSVGPIVPAEHAIYGGARAMHAHF